MLFQSAVAAVFWNTPRPLSVRLIDAQAAESLESLSGLGGSREALNANALATIDVDREEGLHVPSGP